MNIFKKFTPYDVTIAEKNSILGERLKQERNNLNKTQKDFCDYLSEKADIEINRSTLSKYETGDLIPPISQLIKLCNLFECDIHYLLGVYPEKTVIDTDINHETGLKSATINALSIEKLANPIIIDFLNYIIPHIEPLMQSITEKKYIQRVYEEYKSIPLLFDEMEKAYNASNQKFKPSRYGKTTRENLFVSELCNNPAFSGGAEEFREKQEILKEAYWIMQKGKHPDMLNYLINAEFIKLVEEYLKESEETK